MADLEGTESNSSNVAKDLFAGAMGGIAQVLLGMCLYRLCHHLTTTTFGNWAGHVQNQTLPAFIIWSFTRMKSVNSKRFQANRLISSKSASKQQRSTPMP